MPTLARTIRIESPGGPEALQPGELQVRDPGFSEALIEIAAVGVNRADILQRKGVYPAPPGVAPDVPGLEFAGTVRAVGDGVQAVAVGDRVMGLASGGAMATHLVAHEGELSPVPDGMELTDAAAVPEVFVTAYDALFLQGGLRMGQSALIHAVGSGVGTAALQLCRAVGAVPIGTSRDASKLSRCRDLGLEHALDTADGSFAKALKALPVTAPSVVLDTVGAKYLAENVKAVAPRGHIVVIGLVGGVKGELPLGLVVAKRVHLVGSVLRSRSLAEKLEVTRAFNEQVLPLLSDGRLRPIVEDVLPMEQAGEAHTRLESNRVFGKLVLRW